MQEIDNETKKEMYKAAGILDESVVCDVCDYVDGSKFPGVAIDSDGVKRCQRCRQLKEYGQTFYRPWDEYEAYKKKRQN